MFDFVKKYNGRPEICTLAKFEEIIRAKYVADTCKEIADLIKLRLEKVEQQLAASTEPGERAELEKQEKALWEQVAVLKKRLPAFCFHAHFKNGRRKNAEAEKSGLCMFDIDDITNPQATFDETRDRLKALGVVLAHVTPSTRGLRYVFRIPKGKNLAQAQLWFANQMGIRQYDGCTKDMARISYAVTEKYILFMDEEGLFGNEEAAGSFSAGSPSAENPSADNPSAGNSSAANPSGKSATNLSESPLENPSDGNKSQVTNETKVLSTDFKGIPYQLIIDRLLLSIGVDGEPVEGERNTTLFALVRELRYICDFSLQRLLQVVPRWGMSEQEVEQTVQSALSTVRRTDMPPHLAQALNQLEAQQTESTLNKQKKFDPVPEHLPRMLQLLTKSYPAEYHAAILIASLPVLGTLATHARAIYFDGAEHSPSFLSCIVAPQASGKSCTRKIVDLLLGRLQQQDNKEREKERRWMEEKRARKNSKQQPEDPRAKIRIVPATVSNAMLFKRLDCSCGEHLFTYAEEIDTLSKGRKSGAWSQKDDIMRQAFDNSVCGQDYMSDNSWSAMVRVYYNTLTCGTPVAVRRYYNDVEGGLVSRVCFAQLPDMLGAKMPIFGRLTKEDQAEINSWVKKLMAIGMDRSTAGNASSEVSTAESQSTDAPAAQPDDLTDEGTAESNSVVYEIPKVKQVIWDWMEARRLEYLETQENPALDIFRRRAAVIGFRAGLIATLLSDEKETDEAADFAKWVANFSLSQQLDMFGDEMNRLVLEGENIAQSKKTTTNYQSLLSSLPAEFTVEQLVAKRMELGYKTSIKMVVYRWAHNNIIEKLGKNKYRKIV